MKKAIPIIVSLLLILLIGTIYAGSIFYEKYSYSGEHMDLAEYFQLSGDEDTAIFLQDARIGEKALFRDGRYYFDAATVKKYFSDRFYFSAADEAVFYTLPDRTERAAYDTSVCASELGDEELGYTIAFAQGDTVWLAAEYVKRYVNFSYEGYTDPNRMQVYTAWGERTLADVKKKTAVRYQGGIKSEILTELSEGESVEVLESMENWTKVKTDDCFVGYVENKLLTAVRTEQETPVTEVEEPVYMSFTRQGRINMPWHQLMSFAGAAAFRDAIAGTQAVNVISPTWFSINSNEGDVASLASGDYVQAAHEAGVEVWALVDNDINRLYGTDTATILATDRCRKNMIAQLMDYVTQYGLDGLNIDFEQIPRSSGEDFVQFIRELSVPCRANGVVLTVDIYVPTEYTSHYGWEELGVMADYVVMMGYDEHYSGSAEAGSVASIGYVQEGLQTLLQNGVPASKIINGVPFYTRIWKTTGAEVTSEAVSMESAASFIARNNVETAWDETTCQNYGELASGESLYQVWLEDRESMEARISVMDALGIAGVAEWKLGLENKDVWDVIASYVQR